MKESSASPESFGEEELTAYLLGELDVPTSQRLEQRLSEDPELRQLLKELSGSMELIREAFGNPVEQGAPLHTQSSRRSSMQDRFKERAGSHQLWRVFGCVCAMGFAHESGCQFGRGYGLASFHARWENRTICLHIDLVFSYKKTSEVPAAQTALTRSAPPSASVRCPSFSRCHGLGQVGKGGSVAGNLGCGRCPSKWKRQRLGMALESAHGFSRKPQVSDLSEGLDGFQDEGVDRDMDFGLSTQANGLVAIDETTEQWNLPEPQQPQSDSVMMQRYGLLPSDENGRLSSIRSIVLRLPIPPRGLKKRWLVRSGAGRLGLKPSVL